MTDSDREATVATLLEQSTRLAAVDGLTEEALRLSALAAARRDAATSEIADLISIRPRPAQLRGFVNAAFHASMSLAPGFLTDSQDDRDASRWAPRIPRLRLPNGPNSAERFVRNAGGPYLKLAQFAFTASGVVPDDWAEALAWATDDVPAMSAGQVGRVLQDSPPAVRERIAQFDPVPLGSGSIGQTHRATLTDGTEVVIKVLRPNIAAEFRRDLPAIALAASAIGLALPSTNRTSFLEVVRLFATLSLEEMDFELEAANMVEAAAVLEHLGAANVKVPLPVPGMVTPSVLTMEQVPGVAYTRIPRIGQAEGEQIFRSGIKAVIDAALVDGIFHGDLHSGNVLIDSGHGISLVDFGIIGRLTPRDRLGLLQFLAGFAAADADLQLTALRTFGSIPADADVTDVRADLARELAGVVGRADGVVTFDRVAAAVSGLVGALIRHCRPVPPALFLFLKNLIYLAGFAKQLAPNVDVLEVCTDLITDLVNDPAYDLAVLLQAEAPELTDAAARASKA